MLAYPKRLKDSLYFLEEKYLLNVCKVQKNFGTGVSEISFLREVRYKGNQDNMSRNTIYYNMFGSCTIQRKVKYLRYCYIFTIFSNTISEIVYYIPKYQVLQIGILTNSPPNLSGWSRRIKTVQTSDN